MKALVSATHETLFRNCRFMWSGLLNPLKDDAKAFWLKFRRNLSDCKWLPHTQYSVFTQYDSQYYISKRAAFLHKYRCFNSVSRTISPSKIIELGTHAGSGADAYLSASPNAEYLGVDQFPDGIFNARTSAEWRPFVIATQLLRSQGFNFELLKADLRSLERLPRSADMVVVDAAHDFHNQYADMQLALTANPKWLFIDDAADRNNALPAIQKLLREDLCDRVQFVVPINYIDGGLVVRLK